MKKFEILNTMTRSINRAGFKIKKHSPEILIVAGVVGTVTSTVMACKATLKVNEIIDESKENIDKIHEATENGYTEAGESYSIEDSKKDTTILYVQTGVKLVKLYAPALALGTLSLTAVLTSNHILRKRNIALAAAYTAIDKSFKEYRGRVVERFGKELDRELRYNIKAKEVEEKVTNEDGTESTVKKTIEVIDPSTISDYAKFYDCGCLGWEKDPELNLMFLKRQQDYANDRLREKGHLFLNEVYDMLGIDRTRLGQVAGWIYDPNCPNGDNYVDFGIYNGNRPENRRFVNGYENVILLEFNVDGNILEKI